jgi:dGTPase
LTLTTRQNLDMARPESVDELRQAGKMAAFSMEMRVEADHLKKFLRENLYRHPQVLRMMSKARRIIRELFVAYMEDPRLLTAEHRRESPQAQARAIADYIAGMTDRYAIREHQQLFHM